MNEHYYTILVEIHNKISFILWFFNFSRFYIGLSNLDVSIFDPSLSPTLFTNFQFRIRIFFDMMELVNLNAETVSVPKLNDNVVQIKVEQGAKEVLVQFLK